jgi:hypothetical protein
MLRALRTSVTSATSSGRLYNLTVAQLAKTLHCPCWNSKSRFGVHSSPQMGHVLGQMNPTHVSQTVMPQACCQSCASPAFLQASVGVAPPLDKDHFLSSPLQFVICRSIYHRCCRSEVAAAVCVCVYVGVCVGVCGGGGVVYVRAGGV